MVAARGGSTSVLVTIEQRIPWGSQVNQTAETSIVVPMVGIKSNVSILSQNIHVHIFHGGLCLGMIIFLVFIYVEKKSTLPFSSMLIIILIII